jgi:hypothetical protein
LLMAHAYKANGEWVAGGDFGCDCFSAPNQETKVELFSRSGPLCVIAVGSLGVVNVRAMRVSDRHAIDGGPRDDRSRAAEGPLTWRAGPVTLPEPCRRPRRTLLLGLLAGLSCALVSCVACVQ